MKARMLARLAVLGAFVLCGAPRAEAHRLDEYLQQTLFEVEPDRVVLHVDLTPGVAVAAKVVPTIDEDRDGALSASEQSAYADEVRRDLSLSLNAAPLPLRVVATRFPTVGEMNAGTGIISLTFEASLPPVGDSANLRFSNRHDAAIASYLVNCLMPRTRAVRVVGQSRSPDQASYQLALAFAESGRGAGSWEPLALAVLVLALGGLLWRAISREASRLT
jgi:hypothetical protein